MDNLVEADNRFKVELREPLIDTTGFKQIRVSNVEGDVLDITLRRTVRVPEIGNRLRVPPDFGPFPIYPIDGYMNKFDQSIPTKDGVFVPVYQREAMWMHFESRGIFAVRVIVDGVNAVSGEPHKESFSADLRRLALLYENKSIQDYIVAGAISQRWLDGIKTNSDKIMQFVAAPTPNHTVAPSIKSSIKAIDGLRRVQFEIIPRKISQIDRIPITVHTLSREVIHLNISIESIVGDLIDKIHNITSILHDEQIITFADQRLEFDRKLVSYGIEPGSQVFLTFRSGGRPRSHAAQKYMPQTAAQKRLLEHYAAIQENCGEKRAVVFVDANANIVQDIEADTFDAEDWDTENAFIFNLQMVNAPASEIVLGVKPPPCPITMAVRKEYHCPFLSVQNDDEEENNDDSEEEEDENGHKVFEVTTDQSGSKVNFTPVDHLTERLSSMF